MSENQFKSTLQKFIPPNAMGYCYSLWHEYNFTLKIKNKRASKLGDYRFDPKTNKHTITLNNDLNPYSFLITYIHEVAHLITFKDYQRRVRPHGPEWKRNFKKLMLPVLNDNVFPDPVLRKLAAHLKNPKATSCNDHSLMRALHQYNKDSQPVVTLSDVQTGELFRFRKRIFRKEELRRTRYVCCEVKSKNKYLISKAAEVEPLK